MSLLGNTKQKQTIAGFGIPRINKQDAEKQEAGSAGDGAPVAPAGARTGLLGDPLSVTPDRCGLLDRRWLGPEIGRFATSGLVWAKRGRGLVCVLILHASKVLGG